jgi:hypothetical protein
MKPATFCAISKYSVHCANWSATVSTPLSVVYTYPIFLFVCVSAVDLHHEVVLVHKWSAVRRAQRCWGRQELMWL